jgi:hypothetical protein
MVIESLCDQIWCFCETQFTFGLFNDVNSSSDYTATHNTMNNELERIWKESCSSLRYHSGICLERLKKGIKLSVKRAVSRTKIWTQTFRIQSRNANHLAVTFSWNSQVDRTLYVIMTCKLCVFCDSLIPGENIEELKMLLHFASSVCKSVLRAMCNISDSYSYVSEFTAPCLEVYNSHKLWTVGRNREIKGKNYINCVLKNTKGNTVLRQELKDATLKST